MSATTAFMTLYKRESSGREQKILKKLNVRFVYNFLGGGGGIILNPLNRYIHLEALPQPVDIMLPTFSWVLEIHLHTVYLTYPSRTNHHIIQQRIRNTIITQHRQLIKICHCNPTQLPTLRPRPIMLARQIINPFS